MSSLRDTSVVVLHFGDRKRTIEALRHLRAVYPDPAAPRCILVENGARIPGDVPDVERVTLEKNLGFGAGNNAGIRAARARGSSFIVLLNNDVLVAPGTLEAMRAAGAQPQVGLVGVALNERAGTVFGGGRVRWWWPRTQLARARLPVDALDYIHGACMGITHSCLERVGLLSEDLFLYWEDVDYGRRVRQRGLKFAVVDGPRLFHDDSTALRAAPELKTYYLVRNAIHVVRRHGPVAARAVVAALLPIRRFLAARHGQPIVARALADAAQGVVGPAPPHLVPPLHPRNRSAARHRDPASSPDISIIVVTHHSAATIQPCLDALPAAAGGRTIEVVVVDAGSQDRTVARVQAHPLLPRILTMDNRGFGAAANLGAAQARAPLLLFLNPDCLLPLRSLERLLSWSTVERVGAVSGILSNDRRGAEPVGEPFPSLRWYIRRRFRHPTAYCPLPTACSVPWLSGAALLVRADAFRRVGGFAETFFLYYEDVDFCRRLRAAGYTLLLDPTVRVLHAGGQSAALEARLRASDQAEDAYFARYRPPWEGWTIRWMRRPLRLRRVLPLGGVGALGVVLGLFPHALPAAVLASVAWFVGILIARAPDLGTVVLLGSLIPGQVVRVPIGPGITLTDAVLPLVLAAWGVAALRGGRKGHARNLARGTVAASALVAGAILPGLLLAFERLPLADWRAAAAYSARLCLLLALVPLGARVLRRPLWIPRGLVLTAALIASLGLVQVWVAPSVPAAVTSPAGEWLAAALPGFVDAEGWDPHPGRLFSTWLDPNLLGGLFLLALAVLLVVTPPVRRVTGVVACAAALVVTAALVLTKSRTTLGAFLVLLGAQALLFRSGRRLIPLVTAGVFSLIVVPSFAARLGAISTADPTVLLRLRSWQNALTQSAAAPLFGIGYNAYGAEQLARGDIGSPAIHSRSGADSSTLTFLATTGLWGNGLLIGGWVLLLWFLLRRAREQWVAGAASIGLLSLTVHAQFVHSLVYVHLAVPLALLVAAALAPRHAQLLQPRQLPQLPKLNGETSEAAEGDKPR